MATPQQQLNSQYDEQIRRLHEMVAASRANSAQYGNQLVQQQAALANPLKLREAQSAQQIGGAYTSMDADTQRQLQALHAQLAQYGAGTGQVDAQAAQAHQGYAEQNANLGAYQKSLAASAGQQYNANIADARALGPNSANWLNNQQANVEYDVNVQRLDALKKLQDQLAAQAAAEAAARAHGAGGGGGGGRGRGGRGGSGGGSSKQKTYTSYAAGDAGAEAFAQIAPLLQAYHANQIFYNPIVGPGHGGSNYQLIPYTPRTNTKKGQSASLGHQVR